MFDRIEAVVMSGYHDYTVTLGAASSPDDLIWGDPDTIADTAGRLRRIGERWMDLGAAITQLTNWPDWSGAAGEEFRNHCRYRVDQWMQAAEAFVRAADTLDDYHPSLAWAIDQAAEAFHRYRAGKQASEAAENAYNEQVATFNAQAARANAGSGAPPAPLPVFVDPGIERLQAAQDQLFRARTALAEAAAHAHEGLCRAHDAVPAVPSGPAHRGADRVTVFSMDLPGRACRAGPAFRLLDGPCTQRDPLRPACCSGDGDQPLAHSALSREDGPPGGHVLSQPKHPPSGDVAVPPPTLGARPDHDVEPAPSPSPPERPGPAVPTPQPPPPGPVPRDPAPNTPPPPFDTGHEDRRSARVDPSGGESWGPEVLAGVGVAAAVGAAVAIARHRYRARRRSDRDRPDTAPDVPSVYQLRLDHWNTQRAHDDADHATEARHRATPADEPPPLGRSAVPDANPSTAPTWMLGPTQHAATRRPARATGTDATHHPEATASPGVPLDRGSAGDGMTLALHLARAHGLGLIGPGGYAAARVLVLTALSTADGGLDSGVTVVVPHADLVRLLGVSVDPPELSASLRVFADLDAALADLEARRLPGQHPDAPTARTVLVAVPPTEEDIRTRLQQALENGDRVRLTALLLGQWRRPGVTAYVTAAGTISATDPSLGDALRGTRAFTLPDTTTLDLLGVLRTTQDTAAPEAQPANDRDQAPDRAPEPPAGPPAPSTVHTPDALEITTGPPPPRQPSGDPNDSSDPAPPAPPEAARGTAPLKLSVFGAPSLHWRTEPTHHPDHLRDISAGLTSRPVELLVFLAVHPRGVTREAIIDALWPEHPPQRPASVLRTVLSRLRRALHEATNGAVREAVLAEHGQYHLDPAVVEVDYHGFAEALTRRRSATTTEQRTQACEAIVASYGGVLADGLDAAWLTAAREAIRRDALDAVAALARARVDTDPDNTLDLLETARAFDPHNELLYRDIMRLQHTLGRHDAISRTLTLLETRLTELDTTPTPETIDLATRLRARHTGISVDDSTAAPPDE